MAETEVTGFTAEHMLEIENNTVVSGEIVNGRLYLRTKDNHTIDAGRVLGVELVLHGTNPNTTRPVDAPIVYWIGAADPVNAQPWDFHLKENVSL